jgi:hypothetical protein
VRVNRHRGDACARSLEGLAHRRIDRILDRHLGLAWPDENPRQQIERLACARGDDDVVAMTGHRARKRYMLSNGRTQGRASLWLLATGALLGEHAGGPRRQPLPDVEGKLREIGHAGAEVVAPGAAERGIAGDR